MRVAAVQCDVQLANLSANLETFDRLLAVAIDRGARCVVFPECLLTGYAFDSREEACEAAISTEHLDAVSQIIRSRGNDDTVVTLGTLLLENDRLRNSAIAITGAGIVARYDKIHLPHLGVDRFVDRGESPYAAPMVGNFRLGLAICYDCSFPEPMRVLGLCGADVVALGTNWPVAAARTAEVVPPARSMENHYYFIAANRIGTERGFEFCGKSSICGPDGAVLAAVEDDRETVLTADIDLSVARNKRIERTKGAHVIDRMADRQPQFYGPLSSD